MTMPEPVVVLDAFDRPPMDYRVRACDWMQRQGINIDLAWRVEVYVIDTAFARVYQAETNDDGSIKFENGEAVQRRPFDVLVTEMPPSPGDDA